MYVSSFNSKIGRLWLGADDNFLLVVSFTPIDGISKNNKILRQAQKEILEYTQGQRQIFSVPYKLNGTDFQISVWNCLKEIPYGKVWTYHQLAETIGNPKANRAVGNANNQNPLPIIIPCHRVVSSCGEIGGYSGGKEVKQKLLDIETYASL